MPKNKKITLDSLAGMIKREFDGLHQNMDKRFDKTDESFKEVRNKLSNLERRIIYIHTYTHTERESKSPAFQLENFVCPI